MKNNNFNQLDGKNLKIAIVRARFNEPITGGLLLGAETALKAFGVQAKNIKIFEVPGAFEIPIVCQQVAQKKKFNGIITIGAIIKGETAHFDFIAGETSRGIMKVMLDNNLPISFGVITTFNLKQAQKRAKNDEHNKGYEAAAALLETINTISMV